MINVLHLIWEFGEDGVGGLQQFCIKLLENIDRSKYHFDFAVCGPEQAGEKKAVDYGAQIFHLPYIEGRSGKKEYLKQLSALLKNTRYDVVHSHLAFMNISTLKLAKQYGIPIER